VKVLLSAFACDPTRGSEPRVGWKWARQAARFHDVWVLTDIRWRESIEAELRERPVPSLHFIYHRLPGWARLTHVGLLGEYFEGLLWQLTAIPICRTAHREIGFDVAHHVTIVSYQYPSCLAWLPCPLIWGPVGGSLRAPFAFYPSFGPRRMTQELLRDGFNWVVRHSPLVLWTMWRARCIVPTTDFSKRVLPRWTHAKAVTVRGEGMDLTEPPPERPRTTSGLCVLYVGRLVYWKGVHLALRAFAEYLRTDPQAHFTLQMDGPDRPWLEELASRLNISDNVTFDVTSTIAEVKQMYDNHDVFLFPSLHDSGSFVTLEAMSRGLPVICFELGGPAHSVTDQTGVKIRARTTHQAVTDIAAALRRLATNPELRLRMGDAGRRRIADAFSWDAKGEFLRRLYPAVVGSAELPLDATRVPESSAVGAEAV